MMEDNADSIEQAAMAARARRTLLKHLAVGAGWASLGACVSGAEPKPDDATAEANAAVAALPAPIRGQPYRLVQDWDFVHRITDAKQMRDAFFTRYIYNDGQQDALNDEWQRYRDNDNHVFKDTGLALVARAPGGVANGKIESGMLRSKWSGEYGYFEARMKMPGALGMWPAFWLNPQDKTWPPEIDIVEIVNNGRDTTRNSFHFVHSGDSAPVPSVSSLLNNNKTYVPGFDYKDDFHTFAIEWTAQRVRHFVDDVLVVEREFRWVHKDGADAGPAHVLLNLAVGGAWPGSPKADAFPSELLVSYVRVWQRS